MGAAINAIGDSKKPDAPGEMSEADLRRAVEETPGSVVFETDKIELMTHTLWTRQIKWEGKKFGVPSGFPKPLQQELGPWTQRHGVKAKGMG